MHAHHDQLLMTNNFIWFLKNGVDAFVNRRRKTISESNSSDRVAPISSYNQRITQPVSVIMNPKSIAGESQKSV